jgi:hypothetical protein
MDKQQVDQPYSIQLRALGNVMSARRYEMTEFEADAWMAIIQVVPEERFVAFLKHHYTPSPFAPQPSDATKHLDLAINPEVAFIKLAALVASVGPYSVPKDLDPILLATIQALGGWVAVNEHLPDMNQAQAVKAYRTRFDACFNTAVTQVRIEGLRSIDPLKAIGSTTRAQLGHDGDDVTTLAITQRPAA